eukprot:scaffold149_cov315-Pinguiococcus_pyrenoidosus.AAC.55
MVQTLQPRDRRVLHYVLSGASRERLNVRGTRSTNFKSQTGWRGFASKSLEESEKSCLDKCATKYFMLFQRVGFRFAERNAQQTALMQQNLQQPGS